MERINENVILESRLRRAGAATLVAVLMQLITTTVNAESSKKDLHRSARTTLTFVEQKEKDSPQFDDTESDRRRLANSVSRVAVTNALATYVKDPQLKQLVEDTKAMIDSSKELIRADFKPSSSEEDPFKIAIGVDPNRQASPMVSFGRNIKARYEWYNQRVMVGYSIDF